MCGIVGYFGSTGNRLTRVLTGMTSIIYRAPDSTGIGWFGDELEPIRVRKALGSVTGLIKILLSEQAYLNQAGMLLELSTSRDESLSLSDLKKRLLAWEGFYTEDEQIIDEGKQDFPTFDDLIALNRSSPIRVEPGWCGRPDSLPEFSITSADDLVDTIRHLMQEYDISPVVTKTLILNSLSRRLEDWTPDLRFRVEPGDILEEFEEIFDHFLREGELAVPPKNPYASKHLWKLLRKITITIPLDYDPDGVRGLFRLLDASLLCRMSYHPELRFAIQKKLNKIWPESEKRGPVEWMSLYQAEKRVNIYGWAAAAGLAYLQEEEFLPKLKKEPFHVTEEGEPHSKQAAASIIPGHTDPMSLRFFSSPTISHGRWAMQSPVTIRNTHPFFDRTGQRMVVLNGQFNGEVEAELHEFLLRTGLSFQSENSSEYMSLLWGYYFDVFTQEQKHSENIRVQIDAGLKDYSIGSQNIDYRVYSWLKGKTEAELDELAFIEAARKIVSKGGQIAVSGLSLVSQRKIYIAGHNRPVFIARRSCNEDVMVVSDINAAMGLFSQSMILGKTRELKKLNREHGQELSRLRAAGADKAVIRRCKEDHKSKEAALLEAFKIYVLPLEGEEVFARIETVFDGSEVRRHVQVTNFDGEPMPEVEEFETILNPLQPEKEIFKSFYESHLREIPERLNDMLSIYIPDEGILPQLDVKERYLRRRFGAGLTALKRIILVGMGSSYNVGPMAKSLFHKLLPQMNIVILIPVEVEQISNAIDPEKDLVVLLSWSGTTAEMVEFAKDLNKCKAAMIGITGKPFSDMALIVKKSAGVITAFSGEEVTFSAIKSPLCLLFCTELLAVWLASILGREKDAEIYLNSLVNLPDILQKLLEDNKREEFCKRIAAKSASSRAVIVIDAVSSSGTGWEAALKLEENSLKAVGKSLDYHDAIPACLSRDWSDNLIIVNATNKARLTEALDVMKRLYLADVPFAAVSFNHEDQAQVHYYSRGYDLALPKVDDTFQPFVDLIFYYSLAYHYTMAHGLGVPGFPRNRVKSVTASRSRPKDALSPAAELIHMDKAGCLLNAEPFPDLLKETAWEAAAALDWEKRCYREMRTLGDILSAEDPFVRLIKTEERSINRFAHSVFDNLEEGGEVVLFSLDKTAGAAAENIVRMWSRLSDGIVRTLTERESLHSLPEDLTLIIVASENPGMETLRELSSLIIIPCCWLGPELPEEGARFFKDALGYFPLRKDLQTVRSALLYAGLYLLMARAWNIGKPGKALIIQNLLKSSGRVIHAVLENSSLKKEIDRAVDANRNYDTAFYISPPSGEGLEWVERFDRSGALILESHIYGESAHGPLATVDSDIAGKFVRILNRKEMISIYGEEQVCSWEERFLQGASIDSLKNQSVEGRLFRPGEPFFAEGYWYLPVLQPGYDFSRDNLIIIDASSSRFFEQSMDELGLYGCRYARTIVITQESFRSAPEKRGIYSYPIDHLIFLPAVGDIEKNKPIPDLLIPFAGSLLSAAFAASFHQREKVVENIDFGNSPLFREVFGLLGDVMINSNLGVRQLDHNLIAALRCIAPLVTAIEGGATYRVKRIVDEKELLDLIAGNSIENGEDALERYRILEAQGLPFFIFQPERADFSGTALEEAECFLEEIEDRWLEAFGETWQALSSRTLGIRESWGGAPLIELPILQPAAAEGRLHHYYIRYLEWEHDKPMGPQIPVTLEAMQKGLLSMNQKSAGYLTIVNSFNEAVIGRELLWADWLVSLVARSWLLCKTCEELTGILAERAQALLDIKPIGRSAFGLEDIARAVEAVWQELKGVDSSDDTRRWQALYKAVKGHLQKKE